ncbi:MAG: tRNA epoxyqueuosine(34) reductase QueG [Planctomycetes bacterium]|nr:tRNA epoxyqueuosine(34) reductase QueG [Planctomycetota bacterium]
MSPDPLAPYRELALEAGFDLLGVAPAEPPSSGAAFEAWLAAGHHADMSWIERQRERLLDPRLVLPGARTILCLGISHARPPAEFRDGGRVARYAAHRDYHNAIGNELRRWARSLVTRGLAGEARAVVDAGPVLERAHAARAGLGFIGRSSNLLHHRYGPWLFLAEVLIDRELPIETKKAPGSCGTCTACVDLCPTRAIVADRVVDARRCISYWTIEARGFVPRELRRSFGPWVFGCDVCSEVCPFGARAPATGFDFGHHPALERFRLEDLFQLDEPGFAAAFAGSALRRPGRSGLLRNAAIALANLGRVDAWPTLMRALDDADPVVRGHAAWALGELDRDRARRELEARAALESDALAREELREIFADRR